MKNRDILNTYTKLTTLQQDSSLRFPAKVSYAIVRNLHIMAAIAEDLDKTRQEIGKTYGELKQKEDGSSYYTILPENIPQANQELEELLEGETPFDPITITMDSLDNYDLSIETLDTLYFMITGQD